MNVRLFLAILVLWGPLMVSTASAAGFALVEQSVSGLGTAFAGQSAVAADASTVFYNPAGMTRLAGDHLLLGVHFVEPSTKFDPETAENVLGEPFTGGEGGDAGRSAFVPNLHGVMGREGGYAFGIAISSPFGLSTGYPRDWVGRYHAVESELETLNINPAVARKVGKSLSLGAGISAQYIRVRLSSMVDYGLQAAMFDPANVALASDRRADIHSDLEADDWGYGFNLGALYEVDDDTRFGISYRSSITHRLEGDADFSIPSAFLADFPAAGGGTLADAAAFVYCNQGARSKVTLPASTSLSGYHRLTPDFAVMADLTWTDWSRFEKLVIEFERTLPPSVTTEQWHDAWRYSVGAVWSPSQEFALRTGVAYDESPVPERYRTPRVPDADRLWTAIGVGCRLGKQAALDLGYAHLFIREANLRRVAVAGGEDAGRGTLIGSYDSDVDIFSVQLTAHF